jgi:hypothetical protein
MSGLFWVGIVEFDLYQQSLYFMSVPETNLFRKKLPHHHHQKEITRVCPTNGCYGATPPILERL